MRKISIVLCGLLAFALIGGCGETDSFSDEAELTYKDGVLTEQLTTDLRKGSHVLTAEDEEVPLRSTSLNMSSSEYLGNKVQVVGVFDSDDEVFEVTGISVLEILVERPKEAEFVLYKNTDFGFEIKYYEDWPIKEWQNGDIEFHKVGAETSVKVSQFRFDYTPNVSEDGEVDTPLSAFSGERFKEEDLGPTLKIGANGQDSIKYDNGDILAYYMYRNGLIYEISFFDGEMSNENTMVFNEMLNSFRFIGFTVEDAVSSEDDAQPELADEESFSPTDLPAIDSEFSSFSSLPYHFSANYPADWYYSGGSGTGNVLWHYGFRDEAEEGSSVLVSLDVVKEIPKGSSVSLSGGKGVRVVSNGVVSLYVEVEGQKYRVSGAKELDSILLIMVDSIKATE